MDCDILRIIKENSLLGCYNLAIMLEQLEQYDLSNKMNEKSQPPA